MFAEARMILDDLVALRLELSEIDISPDLFLEYLVNCIRNAVTIVIKPVCSKA